MAETQARGDWRLEDLEFIKVPHGYIHRPTGRELRSVTTHERDNGIGFQGYAPQEALDRGNFTHEASALIDQGDLDWASVPEKWRGYVEAYERAMRETGSKPVAAELSLFEPNLWYAGTLDRVVIRRGERIGVELKTGSITDVSVQAAGYDHLWSYWFPDKPIARWECWKLNEDGSYKPYDLDVVTGWRDFVACLCLSARKARPLHERI